MTAQVGATSAEAGGLGAINVGSVTPSPKIAGITILPTTGASPTNALLAIVGLAVVLAGWALVATGKRSPRHVVRDPLLPDLSHLAF